MIFIVGINHNIQYLHKGRSPSESFKQYLAGKIRNNSISLVAEELSVEAIRLNKAIDSVARVVALSANVGHRLVDPDSKTRESLGIPSEKQIRETLGLGRSLSSDELARLDGAKAKYHIIREKYWLSQIQEDHNGANILFICGDSHVESFSSLLRSEGYPITVLRTRT